MVCSLVYILICMYSTEGEKKALVSVMNYVVDCDSCLYTPFSITTPSMQQCRAL